MKLKEKRMALIFGMFFIATLLITISFNAGNEITGEAIKEFSSTKEKSSFCNVFCDKEIKKPNQKYSSWVECHEKCMNN